MARTKGRASPTSASADSLAKRARIQPVLVGTKTSASMEPLQVVVNISSDSDALQRTNPDTNSLRTVMQAIIDALNRNFDVESVSDVLALTNSPLHLRDVINVMSRGAEYDFKTDTFGYVKSALCVKGVFEFRCKRMLLFSDVHSDNKNTTLQNELHLIARMTKDDFKTLLKYEIYLLYRQGEVYFNERSACALKSCCEAFDEFLDDAVSTSVANILEKTKNECLKKFEKAMDIEFDFFSACFDFYQQPSNRRAVLAFYLECLGYTERILFAKLRVYLTRDLNYSRTEADAYIKFIQAEEEELSELDYLEFIPFEFWEDFYQQYPPI